MTRPDGVDNFLKAFAAGLNATNVKVPAKLPPMVVGTRNEPPGSVMRKAVQKAADAFKRPPKFVLVMLPDTGAALYKQIKQSSDSDLGIPSQCVVARAAGIGVREPRGQLQYIANVAMKVNSKLGGHNVELSKESFSKLPLPDFARKPYIVLGADVNHAAPGSQSPSIAALVGSLDATMTRYTSRVSLQPKPKDRRNEELIADMSNMAKGILMDFYQSNRGLKPERIIFYRDGVSEGQFDQVMEVRCILFIFTRAAVYNKAQLY